MCVFVCVFAFTDSVDFYQVNFFSAEDTSWPSCLRLHGLNPPLRQRSANYPSLRPTAPLPSRLAPQNIQPQCFGSPEGRGESSTSHILIQ